MTTETTAGQFRKYEHLERLGHPEVRDIDVGLIHVFPKLDGTNASVWVDTDGHVQCGSRNRTLSADADNHGFHAWVHGDDPRAIALRMLLHTMPGATLYGEWLVPHSLKSYRDDAWRRFWIFDVYSHENGAYVPYDDYGPAFEELGLDVVHPLCTAENPSHNQLQEMLQRNTFLIQDGLGEGIVLKNYAWRNQHGRQTWAKLVSNEFREKNSRGEGERDIAAEIVNELATEAFIRKEWHKVVYRVAHEAVEADDPKAELLRQDENGNDVYDEFVQASRGKIIPRFLGTLYYTFVCEEIRTILKKWKNPTLDFSRVQKLLTIRAKAVMVEVF